jgi:hypothetical protein
LNILFCHAVPCGATEQYCHASGSGVTAFSTSETPSNVADFVATTLFGRASEIIFEILNKKGLKYKNRSIYTQFVVS